MPGTHPHLYELEVPIVVELGRRTMTLREVQGLLPGAVIDLSKHAEDELDLLVNNQKVAKGYAVKVGENFGLRITRVGDTAEAVSSPAAGVPAFSDDDAEDLAAQFLAGQ